MGNPLFGHWPLFFATCLTALVMSGCGGKDPESPPIPTVASAQLIDHGPIFRSITVALSSPGGAEVEYWTGSDKHLIVNSSSNSAVSHEINLTRLRANAKYNYQVRSRRDGQLNTGILEGEFTTGDLPADLKKLAIQTSGTSTQPLTFLSIRSEFTGGVVIDPAGNVVWYGRTPSGPTGAIRRANGNWVLMLADNGLYELSPLGKQVNKLAQARLPAGTVMHHGVTTTPNNTVLFLAFEPRMFDGVNLAGEAIWEWNPQDDSLVKRWSAFDMLSPTVDFGTRSKPSDWFHANSIALGSRGNILVSLHYLNQIISIAPNFGSLEWRLGGPGSTFPVTTAQVFSGQHSARETTPTQVLLFDNGYMRADGTKYSRAIEFKLDPQAKTATTVWEYRATPDIWSSVISSARRLDNGNTLLDFGANTNKNSNIPSIEINGPVVIQEVSPAGVLVWSAVITGPSGLSSFQADTMGAVGGESVK